MSMKQLTITAAAIFACITVAGAQAQTVETIDVVGQPNGCTTVYQDAVTDEGAPISLVTLSCPSPTHTSTQIAQDPQVRAMKIADFK
ncbi:MAG TPA: hypothetical protein VM689_16115 [Aliidongia sp.]|nr:hypothetical protein [Aliidongia sp.]